MTTGSEKDRKDTTRQETGRQKTRRLETGRLETGQHGSDPQGIEIPTSDFTDRAGGAFADGLTLIRFLLVPIVVAIIILGGWPNLQITAFASFLFIIAAITDIFDDMIGGPENARFRKYGWFDDIADTVLIVSTLAAIVWVIFKAGTLGPLLLIPALIIIGREILVGLIAGKNLLQNGWPETKWGHWKSGLLMLSVCILLASPWLTQIYDGFRTDENALEIYNNPSTHVWILGQGLLWLAAFLSLITGLHLILGRFKT